MERIFTSYFAHAWLVLSLVYVFLSVCLFVCVSTLITSAIITSQYCCHAMRLSFGRLDGCFKTGVATVSSQAQL